MENLSFSDQICWAFETVPSRIDVVYWAYSLTDIKYKLRVAAGEALAHHNQTFESLAKIVSQALGGGKKTGSGTSTQNYNKVENKEQMVAAFASVFG